MSEQGTQKSIDNLAEEYEEFISLLELQEIELQDLMEQLSEEHKSS